VLLSVRQLQVDFRTAEGSTQAVKGISFDLARGETVGIVGESGSGKSVTALSIMRLLNTPPAHISGGEIMFEPAAGEPPIDLLRLPEHELRRHRGKSLAMVFQEPMTSLNPVFTCGEQVAEALRLHLHLSADQARKRTLEWFEQVRLPQPERIYRAYPHQISGGQKQRVMIAMALCCRPQLLIADEPTTALDVTVQQAILELLVELRRAHGTAILFISHDLGVVRSLADRVVVMHRGTIVEQGPIEPLFEAPQHPYTKGLLACRPSLDQRLHRLPVVADFLDTTTDEKGQEFFREKELSVQAAVHTRTLPREATEERLRTLELQPALLSVDQLCVWYPSQTNFWGRPVSFTKAVDEVSFTIRQGETLGLVGESGCGKTTLGRAILKLLPVRSGTVRFDGLSVLEAEGKTLIGFRQQAQIVFQDPYSSLNPRLTIGSAITEPMRVHGLYDRRDECTAQALELLRTVGLEEKHFHRYPHEFSGGQRQRICIARALALKPRFLVCDESVSALDVSVQAQVLNLLMDLRDQFGLTYLFISHDLSVVKLMSDRVMVMQGGKAVELAPADELYENPQHEYTRQLIASVPR
jgi:peptide/nickel transport system ATP-binding protein